LKWNSPYERPSEVRTSLRGPRSYERPSEVLRLSTTSLRGSLLYFWSSRGSSPILSESYLAGQESSSSPKAYSCASAVPSGRGIVDGSGSSPYRPGAPVPEGVFCAKPSPSNTIVKRLRSLVMICSSAYQRSHGLTPSFSLANRGVRGR
jgi:hypothetical protein